MDDGLRELSSRKSESPESCKKRFFDAQKRSFREYIEHAVEDERLLHQVI